MKRKFEAELSVNGIEKLKKDLIRYRDIELPNKCKELCKRLMELGITVAKAKIDESTLGKYVTLSTDISSDKMGCKAVLVAIGEVMESDEYSPFNTLLAIEFGAGIHYNPTPNPNADKFGLGVGTFPGQIHAFQSEGWYFWSDEKQQWMHSYGVKATMPMYHASMELIPNVVKIAKEVFQ